MNSLIYEIQRILDSSSLKDILAQSKTAKDLGHIIIFMFVIQANKS